MKTKQILLTSLIILTMSAITAQTTTNNSTMNFPEQVSYIIGYNIGMSMKNQQPPFDFNAKFVSEGITNALGGVASMFSETEMQEIMQRFQENMQLAQEELEAGQYTVQIEAGQKFLEENKNNPDVKVTPSGLQYKVVTMGTGEKPKETSTVTVNYKGTLIDGTQFDSSYDRGEPTSFPLNQVIKGWTEGIQLMPTGSKFIFYIPSDLAYGNRTVSTIPGGSTLIFEVELISFQ